jgi:hypothetical protein
MAVNTTSNATVLGVASLSRTLPVVALALIALFVLMKPEATQGFGFLERVVFWSVHVGAGLGGILVASRLLGSRILSRVPLPAAVVITALTAAAVLAPVYLALESLQPAELAPPPDDWLDEFGARSTVHALIAEFIEVAPVFLAAWCVVNLPLLLDGRRDENSSVDSGPRPDEPPPARREAKQTHVDDEFFSRLPRSLGRDVICVSSDLHYLHVYTANGKAMILGTLRDAGRALGDAGLRVHRSHWVAHAHVERLARRGGALECAMSNGLRIPVSRRNRNRVIEWYGRADNVVSLQGRHQDAAVGRRT